MTGADHTMGNDGLEEAPQRVLLLETAVAAPTQQLRVTLRIWGPLLPYFFTKASKKFA